MIPNPLELFQRAIDVLQAKARADERADMLAFLRKRRSAAETVAKRYPEDAERARIIVQQIGTEIEMIEQGLHVGDAACEAALEQGVSTSLDTNGAQVAA